MTYDVIIAGAGPIGLFLACELGLQNLSVLVLEKDQRRQSKWKEMPLGFRGLNTVSVEALYRRGLLGKLVGNRPPFEKKEGFQFGGHYAGIPLNVNKLDLPKYRLNGPALMPSPTTIDKMESVLTERAEELGVKIIRQPVTSIAEDEDGVTVNEFRAKYLVGCDGGRSFVRKAAGFEFVGTEPKFTAYALHVDVDKPLEPGFHPSEKGMYIVGPGSLFLFDFDSGAAHRQEITIDKLNEILSRVSDSKVTKIHLASTLTDRSYQVKNYRKGRILVAGDAAHIHPPLGAQGMNCGLGDAMNLGWKLASTIRGKDLLDTYTEERHPIGEWVLDWNRAQVSTIQPDGQAVHNLIREIISTTDGNNLFIDRVWGLSQRYGTAEHYLVGCSAPDFEFEDGSRLGSKFRGRGLLVDFTSTLESDKVDVINQRAKDTCGIEALLIRPDGIVAWVAEGKLDKEALKSAIDRWFG